MPKNREFHDYIVGDILRNIPHITSRAMFGGWGLYYDRVIFAIIADNALYFKTDEKGQKEFEKLGSQPFSYARNDKNQIVMSYWLLPEEIMNDEKKLYDWVRRSAAIAKAEKE